MKAWLTMFFGKEEDGDSIQRLEDEIRDKVNKAQENLDKDPIYRILEKTSLNGLGEVCFSYHLEEYRAKYSSSGVLFDWKEIHASAHKDTIHELYLQYVKLAQAKKEFSPTIRDITNEDW
jgi:hypothetical protein